MKRIWVWSIFSVFYGPILIFGFLGDFYESLRYVHDLPDIALHLLALTAMVPWAFPLLSRSDARASRITEGGVCVLFAILLIIAPHLHFGEAGGWGYVHRMFGPFPLMASVQYILLGLLTLIPLNLAEARGAPHSKRMLVLNGAVLYTIIGVGAYNLIACNLYPRFSDRPLSYSGGEGPTFDAAAMWIARDWAVVIVMVASILLLIGRRRLLRRLQESGRDSHDGTEEQGD